MAESWPGGFEGWIAAGGAPRLPGVAGEGLDDVVARGVPFLDAVAAWHRGERVVVVSHGLTLAVLLAHVHGWDQREAFSRRRVQMDNTAVSVVDLDASRSRRCRLLGCSAHLVVPCT